MTTIRNRPHRSRFWTTAERLDTAAERSKKDIYLLSEGNFAYGQNGGSAYKKAELIEARTLRSASWHQSCFNSEGALAVENMVQAGYYPRLSLPDALMSKQTTIGLPLVGISAYPDIISSTVREERQR